MPRRATVQADRVLLADLLRNLAVNALHASTPGNTVRLICTDAGNGWRLAVIDTGCGIPAEAVPHLTEPFYRVDKARARADGGSGIGLALCAEIAAAFGTKLNFASEVGAGTTVSPHPAEKEAPTMKKLSLNAKFITTSLFCLALLAVPALAVQGRRFTTPRPSPALQVPGVMSDEVRLDPLAGALYRYGVQGGSSTPQSYDITKDVFTVIRGKLRQAAARSLLTDDQLTYLLAQLDAGADTNPFQQSLTAGEPNVTYGMVKFTGDLTQVCFDYFIPRGCTHETEAAAPPASWTPETYLVIDYLPDNGPIVDLSIHDENYPAGEDLDTVTQNFIAQLNTTIPGQWRQTTTPRTTRLTSATFTPMIPACCG